MTYPTHDVAALTRAETTVQAMVDRAMALLGELDTLRPYYSTKLHPAGAALTIATVEIDVARAALVKAKTVLAEAAQRIIDGGSDV